MRKRFAAFVGTVRRVVGSKLIVRFHSAKDGWWITDSMGHRHYLTMSLCKLVSPDDLVARRMTLFRWNLEFGFIQRPNPTQKVRCEMTERNEVNSTDLLCPCCWGTNTRSMYVKAVCDDCSCIWWRDQCKPDPRAVQMVNAIADDCHADDCVCWMCRAASDYLSAFPEHNTESEGLT